jgi:putative transposase
MNTWRAGCSESCTSGSEGGPEKPTHREMDRALRSDPYTEIPTDEGKLYLATVLDLASRRLAGFALGEHHDAPLAKALCMAAAVRGGDVDGVIFHTDKGGEYVGDVFATACVAMGVTQSMGRVGSALDNAAAESFNSTLEWELLSRRHFDTKDQARREVARFIDAYNHRRRHSSCDMQPPGCLRTGSRRAGCR